MNKLLLIDDNAEIQEANIDYLQKSGYAVDPAYSGEEALELLRKKTYDCIVLDILMPGIDGFTLCAEARKTVQTPIIFLSCLNTEDDRVKGLMLGGDDFLSKPYGLKELAAHINAMIRRDRVFSGGKSDTLHADSGVMYDRGSRILVIGGVNLVLPAKEYEIMLLLVSDKNKTVPKSELLKRVDGEESTLKVYIKRLRDKLAAHKGLGEIENDFGAGYTYRSKHGDSQ